MAAAKVDYNIDKKLEIGIGSDYLSGSNNVLPGQSMKPLQNWFWLSINITPEILISKSK